MIKIRHWLLPLLTLAAAQAWAGPPAAPKDAAGSENARTTCFVEATTGSHIKKRVCMTEAEYAARKKADQEAMMKMKGVASAERQKGAGTLR
jgi:hypothetical protein